MESSHRSRHSYRSTAHLPALILLAVSGMYLLATGISQFRSLLPSGLTTLSSVVSAAPAVPLCTPVSFNTPPSLPLASATAGLSLQTDAPTLYRIYGNDASQLRSQLQRCGPGTTGGAAAEFTGQTDYTLGWRYRVTTVADSCQLSDIKVGLHTTIAMPEWQPTNSATAGLTGRWQHFDSGLLTHEEGHVTIDKSYAAGLLSELNGMGTIPCIDITARVNGIANADTVALNRANDAYDTATDHGATQGAVLPIN